MINERNMREMSYKCRLCRDTGWILEARERGQPLAVECECRKRDKVKNQWKVCGINPEMINCTFRNFNAYNDVSAKMKDTALSYINEFDNIRKSRKNSVMLCGQVGCGKSHLSMAIAVNMIKRNIKVVYMPYRDTITRIKQNILNEEYYSKSISRLQKCEVLLIDDLFKGRVNESDINIIFEIINYRYLNFLPIIVSSEFTVERLLEFDQGIGSRIFEMCKDYFVEIEKDKHINYRLRK
ncbi:MAG TPA: AAA family ATPase [Clostridium sp.]|nr:AAA family ATPase [Clostridium sp.]